VKQGWQQRRRRDERDPRNDDNNDDESRSSSGKRGEVRDDPIRIFGGCAFKKVPSSIASDCVITIDRERAPATRKKKQASKQQGEQATTTTAARQHG